MRIYFEKGKSPLNMKIDESNSELKYAHNRFQDELLDLHFDPGAREMSISESMIAPYYISLIETYNNTKSMDEVKKIMERCLHHPKISARIIYENCTVFDPNSNLMLEYISRKLGYDSSKITHNLKLINTFFKILVAQSEILYKDNKTETEWNEYIEMCNEFDELYIKNRRFKEENKRSFGRR